MNVIESRVGYKLFSDFCNLYIMKHVHLFSYKVIKSSTGILQLLSHYD
jgi:hypothetical protein